MKQYFATSLHDTEWAARQFMPAGSVPVPVCLVADLKPDARDGRCGCVWSGDSLATVCVAHLEAVRAVEADARRIDALDAVKLRWHDFGGEWNVWIDGQKWTGRSLREIADKVLAAK